MNARYLKTLVSSHDNGNGLVNYREYIDFLRGPISGRRLDVLNAVYEQLAALNTGELTLNGFLKLFNAENHPLVYSGTFTENEIKSFFIDSLSFHEKVPKFVTNISFLDFFSDIFYGYDDDAFENSLRSMFS